MPTRKQRRREMKSKRHQYEFVYVDADGNELDEAPPELLEQEEQRKKERTNGAKASASAQQKKQPQRGGRYAREPQPPSWNRAFKRGGLLGIVVFAMFALTAKGNYVAVLPLALMYTALFVPFTYFVDRFAYRRYQARQAGGSTPQRPAKPKKS
jgi:hypothetical protein